MDEQIREEEMTTTKGVKRKRTQQHECVQGSKIPNAIILTTAAATTTTTTKHSHQKHEELEEFCEKTFIFVQRGNCLFLRGKEKHHRKR